jgi:hypothetical protein
VIGRVVLDVGLVKFSAGLGDHCGRPPEAWTDLVDQYLERAVEGSTENTALVTDLIVGLRERGLDATKPILVVLDGSKALRRAVLDVFDRPMLGRCQLHKIRNVEDQLPDNLRSVVAARMRRAYHAESALAAEAELCALAAELDKTHPGAAASLREGLAETLTVLRLGVPPILASTLRSTNAIESMISICRAHSTNVKRWRYEPARHQHREASEGHRQFPVHSATGRLAVPGSRARARQAGSVPEMAEAWHLVALPEGYHPHPGGRPPVTPDRRPPSSHTNGCAAAGVRDA